MVAGVATQVKAAVVAAACALLSAGCLDTGASTCGASICGAGTVCLDPSTGSCVPSERVEACIGLSEGSPCSFSGVDGSCIGGACTSDTCGNGALDPGEVCDDGNTDEGDGCSSTCLLANCLVPVSHRSIDAALADNTCRAVYLSAGEYTGPISLDRDVQLIGTDAAVVAIVGDGAASVVTTAVDTSITIRGVTIRGGGGEKGAGIHNLATLTLDRVAITDNHAVGETVQGAGIYTVGATLSLDGCDIWGNTLTARIPDGGQAPAVAFGGGLAADLGSVVIASGTSVHDNTATATAVPLVPAVAASAAGGGVFVSGSVFVASAGTAIADNRARVFGGTGASADIHGLGGGAFFAGSVLSMSDTEVSRNTVAADGAQAAACLAGGGGIYAQDSTFLVSSATTVASNLASVGPCLNGIASGGGIAMLTTSATWDDGLSITDNEAAIEADGPSAGAVIGGGVGATGAASITGIGTSVVGNRAIHRNGGIAMAGGFGQLLEGASVASVILASAVLDSNSVTSTGPSATSALGGGLLFGGEGGTLTVAIQQSSVIGNSAGNVGGAIAPLASGGGIAVARGSETTVLVTNSTVARNEAVGSTQSSGGGLLLDASAENVSLLVLNSTVTENSAQDGPGVATGGGQFADTAMLVRNTIVVGNASPGAPECIVGGGPLIFSGNNLVGSLAGCGAAVQGGVMLPCDATCLASLFGTLDLHGGPTPVYEITPASAAHDAGPVTGCSDFGDARVTLDQRGFVRGATCDIGAFEVFAMAPP